MKNIPGNNGKVGVLGSSYPGWLAALAGVGAHPALKAISPQAPIGDAWMGDDFFHQGAFRQTQGVVFATLVEPDPKGFTLSRYPRLRPLRLLPQVPDPRLAREGHRRRELPVWQGFVDAPGMGRLLAGEGTPRA